MKIKIDPEFRDRIPNSHGDGDLREMLQRDGCRDLIIVWRGKNILIDGHRRHAICNELGIGFRTKEMEFADRDQVLSWIDRTALAHRILTPDQTSLIRGRIYNQEKKPSNDGGTETKRGIDQIDPRLSTAEKLAEEHGVSAPTIKRDGAFADAVEKVKERVDPEIEKKIAAGDAPAKSTIVRAAKAPSKREAKSILSGKDKEQDDWKAIAAAPDEPDEPLDEKPKFKNGSEVWPLKHRKLCRQAFGKFVRLYDKSPVWREQHVHVESIARSLNPSLK